ncbi:hypothetical protein RFI_07489, partial [Reticulomyxa filosa]
MLKRGYKSEQYLFQKEEEEEEDPKKGNEDADADLPVSTLPTSDESSKTGNQASLSVRFVTKIEDPSLHVDDLLYTLPSSLRPQSLGEVVNHLLFEKTNEKKFVAFDFLITDIMLRDSISNHLTKHNISSEKTVLIEYMEKIPEPSKESAHQHPDW